MPDASSQQPAASRAHFIFLQIGLYAGCPSDY
jgi:hypothetical protein